MSPYTSPASTEKVNPLTAVTDLWLQVREVPWLGTIRVGNQKDPYGYEHLTSSRFLTFLERSLGFDAFAEGQNNGFEPGITAFDTFNDKRGTWGVGVFKSTRSPFGWNVGRNEAEVNGRLTYLPVYEEDGRYLVHVGVGAAHRDLDQDQARFRARLDAGETLDDLLPEAFAGVREGSKRVMKMRHFDVQLIGGIALHQGKIAEMRTGEGKTLTATLAVYLNALAGLGVHVVTVNDYLAQRDAQWMGKNFSDAIKRSRSAIKNCWGRRSVSACNLARSLFP